MRNRLVLGVAWAASLAVTWFLGAYTARPAGNHTGAPTQTEPRVSAPRPDEAPEGKGPAEKGSPEPAAPHKAKPPSGQPAAKFSMKGVESLDEFSKRFMVFADEKLAQGPQGELELYRVMDSLIQEKSVQGLFNDEKSGSRVLYPWIRFLVKHDAVIAEMTETLFKTAAEDPAWFEGTKGVTLEGFTEGAAFLLPGAVDDAMLQRMRGYATKILQAPKESLPKALQGNLRSLQKDLDLWSPPLSPQELRQKLLDPATPLPTKLQLLQSAKPSDLAEVDVVGILAQAVQSGNDSVLYSLRRLDLSGRNIGPLDDAIIERAAGMKAESAGMWGWQLQNYLQATGREKWEAARSFIEQGLHRGGGATAIFAQSCFYWTEDGPPKEYLQWVLDSFQLPDQTRNLLQTRIKRMK